MTRLLAMLLGGGHALVLFLTHKRSLLDG